MTDKEIITKHQNSPKIYMIRRKSDGEFFNAIGKYFTNVFCNGTWHPNKSQIQLQLIHFDLVDTCEVFQSTEASFTYAMRDITTKVLIQMECLLESISKIRYQLPTVSQANKTTGKHLKNCIEALKGITPEFNEIMRTQEDNVLSFMEVYDDFTKEVAKTELYEMSVASYTLKCLRKNPKSMNGICNKIMKENK